MTSAVKYDGLPPGFVIDEPDEGALPEGFVLDQPEQPVAAAPVAPAPVAPAPVAPISPAPSPTQTASDLPPGFTLDSPTPGDLPPGFVLDQPAPEQQPAQPAPAPAPGPDAPPVLAPAPGVPQVEFFDYQVSGSAEGDSPQAPDVLDPTLIYKAPVSALMTSIVPAGLRGAGVYVAEEPQPIFSFDPGGLNPSTMTAKEARRRVHALNVSLRTADDVGKRISQQEIKYLTNQITVQEAGEREAANLSKNLGSVANTIREASPDGWADAVNLAASGPLFEGSQESANAWMATIGQQVPLLAASMGGSVVGGAVGSLGGPAGATTGAIAGSFAPLAMIEAGTFMEAAERLGLDHTIARKYAKGYGVGSGAIEYAQMAWIGKGLTAKTLKGPAAKFVLQALSKMGGIAWEGVEELSQNALENFLLQKAAEEHNLQFSTNIVPPTIGEGGLRAFAVGAVFGTLGLVGEAKGLIKTDKTAPAIEKGEQLAPTETPQAKTEFAEADSEARLEARDLAIESQELEMPEDVSVEAPVSPEAAQPTPVPVSPEKVAPAQPEPTPVATEAPVSEEVAPTEQPAQPTEGRGAKPKDEKGRSVSRDDFMREQGVDADPGLEHGHLKGMATISGSARKAITDRLGGKFRAWFKAEAEYARQVEAGDIVDPTGVYKKAKPKPAAERPLWEQLQRMTYPELKARAKPLGIKGRLGRQPLIKAIQEAEGKQPAQAKPPVEPKPTEGEVAKPALAEEPSPVKAVEEVVAKERPASAPVEVAGESESVTSIKNKTVDKELEEMGLPPATRGERMTFEQSRADAAQKMKSDAFAGQKLVENLAANPRPVSAAEDALLLHERNRLILERDAAEQQLIDAVASEDEGAISEAKARIAKAQGDFTLTSDVDAIVGTETSLGLGHRRMSLKRDYSLSSMERHMQVANQGKPLSEKQSNQVRQLHQEIAKRDKALTELQAERDKLASDIAFEQAHKKMTPKRKAARPSAKGYGSRNRLVSIEAAEAARKRLTEKLSQLNLGLDVGAIKDVIELGVFHAEAGLRGFSVWSAQMAKELGPKIKPHLEGVWGEVQDRVGKAERADIVEKIQDDYDNGKGLVPQKAQKLAESFVEQGIVGRDALIDSVHTEMTAIDPDITRRQVMDAISGHGEFKALSKNETKKALSDLKGQMRQIAKLEDMAEGNVPPKTGFERRTPSAEEQRLLEMVKKARKELDATNEDAKLKAAQKALKSYKTRVRNQIAEYERRIEADDFSPKLKRVTELDDEALGLRLKAAQFRQEYQRALQREQRRNRSIPRKIAAALVEPLHLVRALITSGEFSAILRQGIIPALAHPIAHAKRVKVAFQALSKKGNFVVNEEIRNRDNFHWYRRSGLSLTELGDDLSQREEAYMSRLADRIPVIAAFERSYVSFLNKTRADMFDLMARGLSNDGNLNIEEAKAIAHYINVATGRGGPRGLGGAMAGLNAVFFSPRLLASRFQFLLGTPLYGGTKATRKVIAKEYARFLIGATAVVALGLTAGMDIEDDPRAADFGKFRFGNTRIDPWGGMVQAIVLVARLLAGETKTSRGKVVDIRGETPFGYGDASDLIWRFLRSKLSPGVGAGVNVLAGENVIGETVTPVTTARDLITPMAYRDIYEAMREEGVPASVIPSILVMLGVGLQTYEPRKRSSRRRPKRPSRPRKPRR